MIDFPAGSQHEIAVERMDDRARKRVAVADKNSANGWKKPVQSGAIGKGSACAY
jgi:hypothetical protein